MITRDDIINLAKQNRDAAISIYLSTHKMGEDVKQDPIRFKNLLSEARKQLTEREVDASHIDELLAEPAELLEQPLFWQHNDEGLAFFISSDNFEYYRLPQSFEERVMVEDHFLISPLIPMISLAGTFCVLALSQKNVRLLKCTRDSAEQIAFQDSPVSLKEFLKFDENENHLQHHSGQGAGRAIFHGQGGSKDTDTEEIINYLKTIENEVTSKLRKRNDPLVLAGVSEAVAEYKKVNHYSRLMENIVTGNPDPKSDDAIREEGWQVIQSYFLNDMYDDMEKFSDLSETDKQSDNLTQIVEAAYYGKIDSLFIPVNEFSWGRFDRERDVVHHSTEPQNGDHDLINMAAIQTLTQSGDVYALDKDDMPNGSSIAAIFRYA